MYENYFLEKLKQTFKYYTDMENCGSFRDFGFIYMLMIGLCIAWFYEKAYKINV